MPGRGPALPTQSLTVTKDLIKCGGPLFAQATGKTGIPQRCSHGGNPQLKV